MVDSETVKPTSNIDIENVDFAGRSPSPRNRGEKQKDRG